MSSWKDGFRYLPTLATPLDQTCHSVSKYRAEDLPIDTMEQRIKYARVRSGLSCAELACHICVHRDYYFILEQKADRISPDKLLLLCEATGADPSFILYGLTSPPIVRLSGSTIGSRIREFRLSTGLSARQFGYRLLGGQKRTTSVNAWESGQYIPEMRSLVAIGRAFGVNAVSFLLKSPSK